MRYVAAYCLASLNGGNPSTKDIEKILDAAGIDCDASSAKKVIDELSGKDLKNIIDEGMEKLGSMPVSGGASTAAAPVGPKADAAAPPPKEKTPEPEEESDEDMGFGLFD